jgi:tetratricopeptide (TPR) repeat protein
LWPAAGARVLITSRFADWAGWAEEVALDVPSIGEAAAYLQSRAAHDDEAGARELAEALGRLPLALDHAAATCRRTHMRFADFAARASRMIEAAPRGAGYPRSVAATFDLAIAEAVAHCPAAEALMAFLAQCTHERVPMTLVEGAIDRETERLRALTTLAEMSLLRHDPFEDGTPAVMVHRLVQAAARARTEARGIAQSAFERMMARFAAIYPTDNSNPRSWPLCAQLTPHLLAQRHAVAEDLSRFEPWPELLNRAGSYLHARGASAQAIPLLRDTLAIYEKTLGAEDANTGTALNNLALLLSDQGDLSGARQLYERALAIHEKTLGPEHPLTATTLNNLARLLADQGDHAAARPLYERALAIHEKTPGPRHPDTAASLGNLANMFRTTGDLAQARVLYERARSIYEEALGPDHSTTAASLNDLANVLTDLGDFASAQVLYERALAICERTLGLEHPSTATSLNNLARLLADRLEFEKARPLYVRAAAIWEKTLGPEHPNTNRIRCNQARLLLTMGDAAAAFALGQSALAAHGKALGRNHPWTADSARVTAEALEAAGRTEEAAALCATYGVTCGDH